MKVKLAAENIIKKYNETTILDSITIRVDRSEFFALLGPSGSGKTTLLRIIAGFVVPDGGKILIEEKDITYIPASKRNMAMVFQNYSLWPHMTVFENVAFGLRIRKIPVNDIQEKVNRVLDMVDLQQHSTKKPQQLSGGQQQRVALARALVVEPDILLLDEPLSNLDAHLRDQLRQEIKTLQKNLGITTIYVTHDQKEAMYLADTIAVMLDGKIVETGRPETIYQKPSSLQTARFLGQLNEIRGVVKKIKNGSYYIETDIGMLESKSEHEFSVNQQVIAGFRPEFIQFPAHQDTATKIECKLHSHEYAGTFINALLKKNNILFKATLSPVSFNQQKDRIYVIGIDPENILLFKIEQ
ncbi:MAG TPA: ABC transporter ATP-binding protein [bacterium]|nr:ABC transporter ATP-binding protein [bacterium]HOL49107.1 ABC transporter ATP-binding protein [bacterium]HPO52122.1 ABC transporter ATP-binding protein [bacterium]HXK44759.1 ABC transporter ATP-binding protein [bacterium]